MTKDNTPAPVLDGDGELARLRNIEAAARCLMDNSPIGDDDQPYASEIVQGEFCALYAALSHPSKVGVGDVGEPLASKDARLKEGK